MQNIFIDAFYKTFTVTNCHKMPMWTMLYVVHIRKRVLLKTDRKQMLLLNDSCTTVSGRFFAVCIFIFHKTEVQTVSLKCLTDLNPNLFGQHLKMTVCTSIL